MVLSSDVIAKCFSSSSKGGNGDAAMGSNRGQKAVEFLPSYLTDARSVETFDAETCPNGALQLRWVVLL